MIPKDFSTLFNYFQKQNLIAFHTLALVATLLIQSCAIVFNPVGEEDLTASETDGGSTPISTASLSISFPDFMSNRTGYTKWFYGTCSEDGTSVRVLNGSTELGSTICSSNAFSIYVDTSSLNVGDHDITLAHADSNNVDATTAFTLNKVSTACDSLSNRQNNAAAGFAGGSGSITDPMFLCTADQLQDLTNATDRYTYAFGNDIYFSQGDTNGDLVVDGSDNDYVSGSGWTPIDYGVFKDGDSILGKRFAIEGLTINLPTTDYVGLFTWSPGFVSELRFYDVNITGQNWTGTLSGNMENISLFDVHIFSFRSRSTVQGAAQVGGLLGASAVGVFSNISVDVDVTGSGDRIGGIIGQANNNLQFFNFKSKGSVSGNARTGGIAGDVLHYNSYINGYSSATVSGTQYVGGITGAMGAGHLMRNVISTGDVTGSSNAVGGLNGFILGGDFDNLVATGNVVGVEAGTEIGPVFGNTNGTKTNIFYSSTATCNNTGTGSCNTNGTSTALSDLYNESIAPLSAYDFTNDSTDGYSDFWITGDGSAFPTLWFEQEESDYSIPFSGSGTIADPYLISTETLLGQISSNPRYASKSFEINTDLDASLVPGGFVPLFRDGIFWGTLTTSSDNMIINFSSNETFRQASGFIQNAGGPFQISDLTIDLSGVVDSIYGFVGGLIGHCGHGNGLIHRVGITDGSGGSITGTSTVGGIVGFGDCRITQSYNTADVTGTSGSVGGIAGVYYGRDLSDNYNSGNIDGVDNVGGMVGYSFANIARCYNSGNITGTGDNIGGIWGGGGNPSGISDSFNIGNVSGNSATTNVGPFSGIGSGTIPVGNYFYSGSSCTNSGAGSCNTGGTSDATLPNFYTPGSTPVLNWNFGAIWQDNSGSSALPTLQ